MKKLLSLAISLLLIIGMIPTTAGALTESAIIQGDLNFDGKITSLDITMIKRFVGQIISPTEKEAIAADMNNDNKITSLDIMTIKKVIATQDENVISPIEELLIDCNEYFGVSSSFNKRDFAVEGNYLYIVNRWTAFKIDISCPTDPIIVSSLNLDAIKTAYCIDNGTTRRQYPAVISGTFIYDDKLIVTTRMAISSMSSLLTDDQIVGSLVMINLNDFSLIHTVNLVNRKMCSTPAVYKDVMIVGLVQGGYAAYKITDNGFVELVNQDKSGGDTDVALEFQACAVDEATDTVVFALYKYGAKAYTINYDAGTSFSLTQSSELKFEDIVDFNYDGTRSHTMLSVEIKDGYAFFPLALAKSFIGNLSSEYIHAGVLVADLSDLTSYSVSELPSDAIPDSPYDNGTDPQPTFISISGNDVILNLGNKGIGYYRWDGTQLVYCGRWGEIANAETEKVKLIDGKIYATYRCTDGSKNILFKSWDIVS